MRPGRARTLARVAPALVAALFIPFGVTSSVAAWTDTEAVFGDLGAMDCATTQGFTTTAGGRLLGGSLLGLDLDQVAEVSGVSVGAAPHGTAVLPLNADVLGDGAFANPLRASVLEAVNLDLGGLLVLPLAAETGVVNQYGRALATGVSAGAAGLVGNSGAIDLDAPPPGSELPDIATLELGAVLSSALGAGVGTAVAGLADVRLGVGTVASSATLDACDGLWARDVYGALQREYLVAGLDAELDTPLVGDLVGAVTGTLDGIDDSLDAVAGDSGLVDALLGGVLGVVGPLLLGNDVDAGAGTASVVLDADFSAVHALLATPLADTGGLLEVDLAEGLVRVDLAQLLGPNHQASVGLNGQAPNTELVLNAAAVTALTAALTDALDQWVSDVLVAVEQALGVVTARVGVHLPLSVLGILDIATLDVTVDASLASLLDGSAVVSAVVNRDAGLCGIIIVGDLVCPLLNGLVGGLTTTVTALLGPAIGGVLVAALAPTTSLVATLGSTLGTLTTPVVALVADSLGFLFGPDSLLSLVVNAQNSPAPGTSDGAEPAWASALPPGSGLSSGRYDVAALRLVVLGGLGGGVALDLARSSVGPNTLPG